MFVSSCSKNLSLKFKYAISHEILLGGVLLPNLPYEVLQFCATATGSCFFGGKKPYRSITIVKHLFSSCYVTQNDAVNEYVVLYVSPQFCLRFDGSVFCQIGMRVCQKVWARGWADMLCAQEWLLSVHACHSRHILIRTNWGISLHSWDHMELVCQMRCCWMRIKIGLLQKAIWGAYSISINIGVSHGWYWGGKDVKVYPIYQ